MKTTEELQEELRKDLARKAVTNIFTMLTIKWVVIIVTTRVARKMLEKS